MPLIKVEDLCSPWPKNRYIEVYVKVKSTIRKRGYNTFFNVDLFDDSAEIKATIFNFACDRYYNMIQTGGKYRIENGDLRGNNKLYSKVQHDHIIYFTNSTRVTECLQYDPAPIEYNFTLIMDIPNVTPGSYIDVIGIVKDAGQIVDVENNRAKRRILIADDSGGEVELMLWNEDALDFQVDNNSYSVVLLKDTRVSEFRDTKTLDLNDYLFINPDLPRTHELKYWYLTTLEKWVSIYDVLNIESKESVCLGTVTQVYANSHLYKACVHCKSKMENPEEGLYKCIKCSKFTDKYEKWFVLSMKIADPTGELELSAFGDVAEKMIGKTIEEIYDIAVANDEEFSRVLQELRFKSFVFQLIRKADDVATVNVRPMSNKEVVTRIMTSIRANKYGSILM